MPGITSLASSALGPAAAATTRPQWGAYVCVVARPALPQRCHPALRRPVTSPRAACSEPLEPHAVLTAEELLAEEARIAALLAAAGLPVFGHGDGDDDDDDDDAEDEEEDGSDDDDDGTADIDEGGSTTDDDDGDGDGSHATGQPAPAPAAADGAT